MPEDRQRATKDRERTRRDVLVEGWFLYPSNSALPDGGSHSEACLLRIADSPIMGAHDRAPSGLSVAT